MLTFRFATLSDADMYFDWVNDELVRQYSFNSEPVLREDHDKWFVNKLYSNQSFLYVFENESANPVGQVRIEIKPDKVAIIGVSVAKEQRGKNYSFSLIREASNDFLKKHPDFLLHAFIMKENVASYKAFLKAGFGNMQELIFKERPSYLLVKSFNEVGI